MVIISLIPMIYYYRGWKNVVLYQVMFFIFVLFFIYFNWHERNNSALVMSLCIIGPPIMFFSLPNKNICGIKSYYGFWKYVLFAVFAAFLVNSGMAIVERLSGEHIFGLRGEELAYQISDVGFVGFRSTGIYGHPLKNALITSTFMSYVLISPLRQTIKFSLWSFGYMALLCFNERASIVGNALLLISYVIHMVFLKRKVSFSQKIKYIVYLLLIVVVGIFLIVEAGFAGRLVAMGVFDENSAQVRLKIWDVFKYHNLSEFLYGHSSGYMDTLAYSVGVSIIENFWLIYIFRYGLIFVCIYAFLYFLFMKRLFKDYNLFDKMLVIFTFWIFASINNSLASGFMTLWYFLLLSVLFNPLVFAKIVKKKYIDINQFRFISDSKTK